MARPKKYPDELVARGVRLALESGRPIAHVAADLGMHPETLRKKAARRRPTTVTARIAEHWVVRDDLGMMLQIGAISASE